MSDKPSCSIPIFPTPGQQKEREIANLAAVHAELEKTRNEFSDYKAQQAEQRKADAVQAEIDKKKQRRHELFVAAFTVAFTLFLEHIGDIVKIAKLAFEALVALAK